MNVHMTYELENPGVAAPEQGIWAGQPLAGLELTWTLALFDLGAITINRTNAKKDCQRTFWENGPL